jgi:DDE superfamily endonuclease
MFKVSCYCLLFSLFLADGLAVVDFKKRFIDIEVGWPGSVGDGRIWQNSVLSTYHMTWLSQFPIASLTTGPHREEQVPAFILADSAYPNTKNMVTTFKATECNSDHIIRALNRKLGAARYHVENAFGILKMRFQLFKKPLECAMEDTRIAIYLTSAIFVLHNFLIDIRDSVTIEPDEEWIRQQVMPEEDVIQVQEEEESTRHMLIRHM